MYSLDRDLKYTWKNREHPRQTKFVDRACDFPSNYLTIDRKGRLFHCICDGWLPFTSGFLLDFSSLDEIINSNIAQKLQQSTQLGGSFKFCNTAHCGIRHQSNLNPRGENSTYSINLAIDDSCNLQCPSCRESLIFYKSGIVFEFRQRLIDHFKKIIESTDKNLTITVGSHGDAFASLIYRNFLYSIGNNRLHRFILKTNGLLIEKKIKTLPIANQIQTLDVSIDAGSKEVYNLVRPPGDWNKLLSNLDFVKENIKTHLRFNFIIQKNNFRDIYNFLEMCKKYNATPGITMLEDWGTWHNFYEHNINDNRNQYYNEWQPIKKELLEKGLLIV